ncbi:F-box/LRR-repeat protein at4g14096 [Phtheirospermum japonicum]|uniref:F-box/LRR-repeat protein at4g14096 n=1 Tax=Phtheirospermum japonicum TaxID=374723 RepID=A0A830BVQ9_9LAMI|nr:F-box/LRR-repeat protein at4g14096 [Phtheirospermum japonicum]
MEKGKKIKALDGEIPLPESIIQHIQSFLNKKQAAQTALLSKSWRNAWSTSPNLDLDQRNFPNPGQIAAAFSEFANKTMQRYLESNLKIEKFSLWMKSTEGDRDPLLANELISKALRMGVHDLNFEIHPPIDTFVLPDEVLGAETLIGLSLIGCKINRPIDGKVSCSRLKFLSLRSVYISDDVVCDIISNCPLIESLLLSGCENVIDIKLPTVSRRTIRILALRNPMKKSFEFHNLKSLSLDRLNIDGLFTHDFCLKFRSLLELTLSHCYCCKRIQISSPSLECITLEKMRMFGAKFDVPNMQKFKFSGSIFPFLAFSTLSSSEWLSEISIRCMCHHLGGSFFLKLKRFLTKLSTSKIYLSIVFPLEMEIYSVGDLRGLPRPVVENLMLSVNSSSSVRCAVLDGLFRSFRPKVINQYWFPRSYVAEKANNELLELLCRTLMQQASRDCCIYFGLSDLEEVNVEIFEETVREWGPLPWKTLLDASTTSPEYTRKIRFQLR